MWAFTLVLAARFTRNTLLLLPCACTLLSRSLSLFSSRPVHQNCCMAKRSIRRELGRDSSLPPLLLIRMPLRFLLQIQQEFQLESRGFPVFAPSLSQEAG